MTAPESISTDFIRAIVQNDLESNKYDGRVVTRFPPVNKDRYFLSGSWAAADLSSWRRRDRLSGLAPNRHASRDCCKPDSSASRAS